MGNENIMAKLIRTKVNEQLFEKAKIIIEDNVYETVGHIGWYGVGKFIDWLESNYELKPKK